MRALILVGGFGTRLRPLTLSKPKPLVEFCNKAMIMHQIEALAAVGCTEVVLAVNYQPEKMREFLDAKGKELGIKITTSQENEPMGTAGPIKLAESMLNDGEPFFVLNSDVSCDYPFQAMIEFQKNSGASGVLLATPVEDPSKFGVIIYDDAGKIERFVEKPQSFISRYINAGIYLFTPAIFDKIELRPTSIETEVFPGMAAAGSLYVMELDGFWADVGQPKDFLTGMALKLNSMRNTTAAALASGPEYVGNVLVDPTATIGKGCKIGPDVVIGPGCVVGDGVRLQKATLLPGAKVRSYAYVANAIIGWDSTVGEWVRIEKMTVLGEDVHVKPEHYINGSSVLPHKSVKKDLPTPQIMM